MSQVLTPEQTTQRLIGAVCAVFGPSTPSNALSRVNALLEYAVDLLAINPEVADQVDPQRWTQLASYSKNMVDQVLVSKLHESHRHPDYEYQEVVSGRKQGDGEPPVGHGWETNWLFHSDGTRYEDHQRDDFTDTAWWRRLKTDAARDEVDPFDYKRPKVTLEPIDLHEVLMGLAKRLNAGYFPVPKPMDIHSPTIFYGELIQKTITAMTELAKTQQRPEFNSKPTYIEHGSFLNGLENGVNKFQPSLRHGQLSEYVEITKEDGKTVECNTDSLYAYIELKEADILVDLNSPFLNSFLRVNLKGIEERAPFRRWVHFAKVPINPYELSDNITTYF